MLTDYTISATQDGSADAFRLVKSSTNILAYVNGTLNRTMAISTLGTTGKITVSGSSDADTLTIDESGGILTGFGGVTFTGAGGTNQLIVSGGSATSEDYTVSATAGSGTDVVKDASSNSQTVTFTGVTSTLSNSTIATLTVIGTSANEAIAYGQGATTSLGRVAIGSTVPIDFSGKATLVINGAGGTDTLDVNNSNKPTGLTAITVNSTATTTLTPPPTSGNILWLDSSALGLANGAAVTSMTDLSASHNNMIAAGTGGTFVANAFNGKGAVRFIDGVNGLKTTSNIGITGDGARSVFGALSFANGRIDVNFGSGSTNSSFGLQTAPDFIKYYLWGNDLEYRYDSNPRTQNVFDTYGMTHDSTSHITRGYLNNTELGNITATLTTTASQLSVGINGWEYADGNLGELLVYNRVLSTAERQQVEDYLRAKWISLPSAGTVAITVHSQSGVSDVMTMEPSGAGAGTINFMDSLGNESTLPTITFSSAANINLVGQATDADTIGVDGTTGYDDFVLTPGATADAGTITGAMNKNNTPFTLTPVSFSGMTQSAKLMINSAAFSQGGGLDTFHLSCVGCEQYLDRDPNL